MGNENDGRKLRPGDVVEVRSPAEILATLDDRASTEGMPFMPEMLRYAGRRFTVSRRVEKICDTAGKVPGEPSVSRRMRRTVYLDDLRCDGSGHDGCQAGCRLYWNEDWLRPVDEVAPAPSDGDAFEELAELAEASTTTVRASPDGRSAAYRCQATEVRIASEPLHAFDPRQHVREITAGNVSTPRLVRVLGRHALERSLVHARMLGSRMLAFLRIRPLEPLDEPRGAPIMRRPEAAESMQPGDVVRIRPLEEIERTLVNGRHRGLWFDAPEMGTYCGGTYVVKDRVRRIIDDQTGQMIELESDCLILDGVCCTGEHSDRRWFCPRGIYSYWREDWLELVQKASVPHHSGVA
jgi:hypothetical protein